MGKICRQIGSIASWLSLASSYATVATHQHCSVPYLGWSLPSCGTAWSYDDIDSAITSICTNHHVRALGFVFGDVEAIMRLSVNKVCAGLLPFFQCLLWLVYAYIRVQTFMRTLASCPYGTKCYLFNPRHYCWFRETQCVYDAFSMHTKVYLCCKLVLYHLLADVACVVLFG